MANIIRGALGRVLLFVLALIALGSAYVLFIQFPTDAGFWKTTFSLVILAVTLTSALISSLTLGTRYVIVGVLGMAASLVGAVTGISSLWSGKSSGSGIAGLPTSPAEVMSSYMGSTDGNSVGAAFVIVVALVTLALPLINTVLYFAYQSNPVGEILGLVTVAAILGNIVLIGTTTASSSGSAVTLKWMIFLGIIAVLGIVGTPVAASFDSDATDYASRNGIHYDIKSEGTLPSALPTSFQTRKPVAPVPAPVQEDPVMPHLDYRP